MGWPMPATQEEAANDTFRPSLLPLWEVALEAMPEGVVIIDGQDRVVAYNRRFCEMFGVDFRLEAGAPLPELLAILAERLGATAADRADGVPSSDGRELFRLADGRVVERSCKPGVAGGGAPPPGGGV